jgi:hypothetical protein
MLNSTSSALPFEKAPSIKLNNKVKRFNINNSIYHESVFEPDEKSLLSIPSTDIKFRRVPSHLIPGDLNLKLDLDRTELYRKIIAGKEKVKTLKHVFQPPKKSSMAREM